jgi:Leucine-rich repeat (LRR) protein
LDLTGNSFRDPEKDLKVLKSFNFLKKINLTYNNLETVPQLPKTIETLILNNNNLLKIPEHII